jgi:hypothetical protein
VLLAGPAQPPVCVSLTLYFASVQLGMPPTKQKLRTKAGVHLNRDNVSLAFYNMAPPACAVELAVKERGGRKK